MSKELAIRLKQAREKLKLSQSYVAELTNLSIRDISDIENNRRAVSNEELTLFSIIYGLTKEELLYGKKIVKSEFINAFLKMPRNQRKKLLDIADRNIR